MINLHNFFVINYTVGFTPENIIIFSSKNKGKNVLLKPVPDEVNTMSNYVVLRRKHRFNLHSTIHFSYRKVVKHEYMERPDDV